MGKARIHLFRDPQTAFKPNSKAMLETWSFKNPNMSNQDQKQCETLICFHMSCY